MSKALKSPSESVMNSTSQMAFAIAVCALVAAGVGSIINHWLTGWMAVGGMVGVGLFYLAVGLLNLKSKRSLFDEVDSMSNTSQRTARPENLYAEAISPARIRDSNVSDSSQRLRIRNDD